MRQYLKASCTSSLGTAFVDKMRFTDDFHKIRKLLYQTEEFRQILLGVEPFPSANYIDVSQHLEKAQVEEAFLSEEEFYELQLSLDTIFKCLAFFQKTEETAFPHLKALSDFVHLDEGIIHQIRKIIDEQGKVRNTASPTLNEIRHAIINAQHRVRRTLDRILHTAKSDGYTLEDALITLRGGRMVIPVLAEHKRHIKGFIHDESATGQTVFLEPTEVLEINNELRDLEYQEKREVIRILKALTTFIRSHIQALKAAYHFLGMIDFIRAKARFAIQLQAQLPQLEKKQVIHWFQARHPLLDLSLQQHGKKIVPLDIAVNGDQRILVISGPNAGGKSVCLKTVALLQYMLQCGMLIPVAERSQAGIFQSIFIDIGDEQSLENDLSTYSSHLTNMQFFLKFADKKALFLIDEFGVGTEPQFGGAIAQAILEDLNHMQAFGIITTHYTNLKQFADSTPGIVNAAMVFDSEHLEPLYQLQIGKPGSSYALEIAHKIGLPQKIIEVAKQLIGKERVSFDQMLNELEVDKKKYQELTQKVSQENKLLNQRVKEYEELKYFLEDQKKKIIDKAKEEARRLLSETNQQIEHTIRTIKESQAEKQKTLEARKNLETFSKKVKPTTSVPKRPCQQLPQEELSGPIIPGDYVRIPDRGAVGEVLSVKGEQAEISIGALKSNIKLKRLEKISKNTYRKLRGETSTKSYRSNIDLNQKLSGFSTNLDIRGKRAEEILPIVENFVSEGNMFGFNELRIIHGKGDGILRKVVRDHLKQMKVVKTAHDEHVEQGGAGVTIVELA